MKAKRKTVLGLAVVAVVLLATIGFLWPPESLPGRIAYDAIKLGMSAEDAVRLVPSPVRPTELPGPASSCNWEGLVDGDYLRYHRYGRQVKRVDEKNGPAFRSSRVLHLHEDFAKENVGPGMAVYWDKKTMQTMGRHWISKQEILFLAFDTDGKVAEKAHVRLRQQSPLWGRAQTWLDEHCRF